ncbi:hypothetical protein AHF37_01318 [Paragonimus kellicotti]|nr:hypothetical protein AHF37_01318 [Paragonimus kellicotti]
MSEAESEQSKQSEHTSHSYRVCLDVARGLVACTLVGLTSCDQSGEHPSAILFFYFIRPSSTAYQDVALTSPFFLSRLKQVANSLDSKLIGMLRFPSRVASFNYHNQRCLSKRNVLGMSTSFEASLLETLHVKDLSKTMKVLCP